MPSRATSGAPCVDCPAQRTSRERWQAAAPPSAPLTTTASALLAWQQYGDAEYRDRLVMGNKLRDPAFHPSTNIQVVDEVTNG